MVRRPGRQDGGWGGVSGAGRGASAQLLQRLDCPQAALWG
jgi:hypothetical protein